jgi:RimJ/RimL family protein N-acetyltransferase
MALKYYFKQDGIVAEFVARVLPHARGRSLGPCETVGVLDKNNELIAGFVYHHYSPENGTIELGIVALPGFKWLTRTTLLVMMDYPFNHLRCQAIIIYARLSNKRILRQLAVLGFMFTPVPRLYGRDADGVICLLTDDAWRANKFSKRPASEPKQEAA